MDFFSTRGEGPVSGARAIVNGIAKDGGLYVPSSFPKITADDLSDMVELEYYERAAYVMSLYLDEFGYDELKEYAKAAYDKFDGDPAPLVKVDEQTYLLELWHGPTLAFKDVALTMLPYLLTASKKKLGEKNDTLVLVATSGDTGKAALEGFKDVDGTEIMVFYPSEGVSYMQKLQMTTTGGANTYVAGIKGNFDDAQSAVKQVFTDPEVRAKLKEGGYVMSSANSINWGRLLPQVAYYFSAYVDLVTSEEITLGDAIDFVVPTGNFGDILAGYYAMRMGLPVRKLVCASNINNVLTDFFESGVYDLGREFHKTISPSMDILISSNLERLVFEIEGRDSAATLALMTALKREGKYAIDLSLLRDKAGAFAAGFADEEETKDTIADVFDEYGYLIDPHTAVAVAVNGDRYEEGEELVPTVVLSTANPYKFTQDVLSALGEEQKADPFEAVKALTLESGVEPPEGITRLEKAEVRFLDVLAADEIKQIVLKKAK